MPAPGETARRAEMTAEEMKATESGAQSAPLPIEGVDISPKQDEGVLKVRGGGACGGGRTWGPAGRPSAEPGARGRARVEAAASAASRRPAGGRWHRRPVPGCVV